MILPHRTMNDTPELDEVNLALVQVAADALSIVLIGTNWPMMSEWRWVEEEEIEAIGHRAPDEMNMYETIQMIRRQDVNH